MIPALSLWCSENKLSVVELDDNLISIEGTGVFLIVEPKQDKLIREGFILNLNEGEKEAIEDHTIDFVLFSFGGRFYYSKITRGKTTEIDLKFTDFKYLGVCAQDFDYSYAHLGVHTEYEAMNGTHDAKLWVSKAKFFGHSVLGICDRNTLSGVLNFQVECVSKGIKPIIGETVSVLYDESTDNEQFTLKLYVKSEKGWRNLLRINKIINVDNEGEFIPEQQLLQYGEGLVCVVDTDSIINKKNLKTARKFVNLYKECFDDIYYQFDTAMFDSLETDRKRREEQKVYLNYLIDEIKPVLINDSFYVDKEEAMMKLALNKIDKKVRPSSRDQYYKNIDDSLSQIASMFNDEKEYGNYETCFDLYVDMINNTIGLSEQCDYLLEVGVAKLPDFEYKGDHEKLFKDLAALGWQNKIEDFVSEDKHLEYYERLEYELKVIINAGFIDYFLILWDVIRWCREEGILVGNARGSVAGSLVAYLLGITEVDPLLYNLLFERFLNETRVSGERAKSADALPDIDIDFESGRRDEVKRYIENKYGRDYVCSIGTYTRMGLKGGLKDFNREIGGVAYDKMNFVTKQIDRQLDYDWEDLFKYALTNRELKEYVQAHKDVVHDVKFSLNQIRSASIHASAVVIVPKHDKNGEPMTIFDWFPVRTVLEKGQKYLVSEWEGKYIDKSGFLKEDVLGLTLLDKFHLILDLIHKHYRKKIVLERIPLDDRGVYKLFHSGFNEDIFQFGSDGLKSYSKLVKPDNIEELIAMNALFRPGPMSSKAHLRFADIKQGKEKPEYDYGLKEVTKDTFGLYVYQEQIMKAVHVLGGLTLSEADEVRTIMKKFDANKMKTFEDKFMAGAAKNGCKLAEAQKIWKKLFAFSSYGFNKSHSTAYSIMAYWQQWFKYHYPLETYTAALVHAKTGKDDYDIPNILSEIKHRKLDLYMRPPDVNYSDVDFTCDPKTKSIYWSIVNIKGLGEVAANSIIAERKANGKFDSLISFMRRMKGKKVNKSVVGVMILAGSFDQVEGIKSPAGRLLLLKKMAENYKETVDRKYFEPKYKQEVNWIFEQKRVCGFGVIDYGEVVLKKNPRLSKLYVEPEEFFQVKGKRKVCIAGLVQRVIERKYGKGKKNKTMGVADVLINHDKIRLTLWDSTWAKLKTQLTKAIEDESVIIVTGTSQYSDYSKVNEIMMNDFSNLIVL